jgi:hypothetical protein
MQRLFVILLLAVPLLVSGGMPTTVDVARADEAVTAAAAAAKAAADEFIALGQGSATSGNPPRESDPKVKALLDTIFATQILLDTAPVPFSEIQPVLAWMQTIQSIGGVYMFAGTGVTDMSKANLSDPQLIAKTDSNMAAFASESGRYVDAQLASMQALIQSVEKFITDDPAVLEQENVKSGLEQIRAGLAQTLTGVITTIANSAMTDDWRRARLPAVTSLGNVAVSLLLPEQCASLRDISAEASGLLTDADVKSSLKAFSEKLATCAG